MGNSSPAAPACGEVSPEGPHKAKPYGRNLPTSRGRWVGTAQCAGAQRRSAKQDIHRTKKYGDG
eukprot:10737105-Alexandrium_andersonii.AAC.1